MGEIRSTLDIVMEKAKGITVSEEEKTEFARKEIGGKVRGWLQKYLDGSMSMDQLEAETAALSIERKEAARGAWVQSCLDRMDLEGDNAPLMRVLSIMAGLDTKALERHIREQQQGFQKEKEEQESRLYRMLAEKGIRGPAVRPNLAADSGWRSRLEALNRQFRDELEPLVSGGRVG